MAVTKVASGSSVVLPVAAAQPFSHRYSTKPFQPLLPGVPLLPVLPLLPVVPVLPVVPLLPVVPHLLVLPVCTISEELLTVAV